MGESWQRSGPALEGFDLYPSGPGAPRERERPEGSVLILFERSERRWELGVTLCLW